MEHTDNSDNKNFFLDSVVEKRLRDTIEIRFETLLKERGLKWSDAYNEIGLHKSYASLIRRGLVIPPEWMRIKIAKFFNIDSSVIWKIPEIVSADKYSSIEKKPDRKVELKRGKENDNS